MKTFLIVLFFSFSAYSMGSKRPSPLPELPVPADPPKTEIATATGFKVEFLPIDKYSTQKEREIIAKAAAKIDETVRSGCFKDFILSSRLLETDGRTNAQVLAHILGMVDKVPVKMYYRWKSSAVAYRQPPEKTINLNSYFFTQNLPPCRWAATMAHEALGHSLGNYGHSYKWTVEREYSVPYKLGGAKDKYGGNAFSKCCKD